MVIHNRLRDAKYIQTKMTKTIEVNNMGLLDRAKRGIGLYYIGKIKGKPYY